MKTILLDGTLSSDLNWKEARTLAEEYAQKGERWLWEMDLGLFGRLSQPLSSQTQYATLGIALDHFRDTLWKDFQGSTLGLSLYRGLADWSVRFPWNDELISNLQSWVTQGFSSPELFAQETGISLTSFSSLSPSDLQKNGIGLHLLRLYCRDAGVEYLNTLVANLPDAVELFLFLDLGEIRNPYHEAQLLTKERFSRWNLTLSNSVINSSSFQKLQEVQWGICLPEAHKIRPSQSLGLEESLKFLMEQRIPFRIIPETFLITDWDQLDHLIVSSAGVSVQGRRKLQGFCAAGGTVHEC